MLDSYGEGEIYNMVPVNSDVHGAGRASEARHFASSCQPLMKRFRWRPQLRDPSDEMVLETAIISQADALITHRVRHDAPAPRRFGLRLKLHASVKIAAQRLARKDAVSFNQWIAAIVDPVLPLGIQPAISALQFHQ